MKQKDRFDLEDRLTALLNINDDIDTLMFAYSDSTEHLSEDALLNMLIGVKELHNQRYNQMWQTFEALIHKGVIKNLDE
tara:strand:- start:172 stop:408 length:237 start_codon:yes stop_codon:yes gene_type:complete